MCFPWRPESCPPDVPRQDSLQRLRCTAIVDSVLPNWDSTAIKRASSSSLRFWASATARVLTAAVRARGSQQKLSIKSPYSGYEENAVSSTKNKTAPYLRQYRMLFSRRISPSDALRIQRFDAPFPEAAPRRPPAPRGAPCAPRPGRSWRTVAPR